PPASPEEPPPPVEESPPLADEPPTDGAELPPERLSFGIGPAGVASESTYTSPRMWSAFCAGTPGASTGWTNWTCMPVAVTVSSPSLLTTSGATVNSWTPACLSAALSASSACWYGSAWSCPCTCTPSWSIVTGTPPIEAAPTSTATVSVGLPVFVIEAVTSIFLRTIWPPPRLTVPRLDSPLVASPPLLVREADVVASNAALSGGADGFGEVVVGEVDVFVVLVAEVVEEPDVVVPGPSPVGRVTVGTGIGRVVLLSELNRRRFFRSRLSGAAHLAFQAASATLKRRLKPFGACMPLGAPPDDEASWHSAVASYSLAWATAYGPPLLPNDSLSVACEPGQRASAYWGCEKLPAAAVWPSGPVSNGLDVPSANGELSTCAWAIE